MGELHAIDDDLRVLGEQLRRALPSDEEIAALEARDAADRRDRLMQQSGVHTVLTDDGLRATRSGLFCMTRSLHHVRRWWFSPYPVLLLCGPKGVGKTLAAAALLSENPGYYSEASDLCRMRRENYGEPSKAYFRRRMCQLLVIDELGTEDDVGRAQEMLQDVVNNRQRLPRKTLLMGNLNAKQFKERYDSRTHDRLGPICVARKAEGPNLRQDPARGPRHRFSDIEGRRG